MLRVSYWGISDLLEVQMLFLSEQKQSMEAMVSWAIQQVYSTLLEAIQAYVARMKIRLQGSMMLLQNSATLLLFRLVMRRKVSSRNARQGRMISRSRSWSLNRIQMMVMRLPSEGVLAPFSTDSFSIFSSEILRTWISYFLETQSMLYTPYALGCPNKYVQILLVKEYYLSLTVCNMTQTRWTASFSEISSLLSSLKQKIIRSRADLLTRVSDWGLSRHSQRAPTTRVEKLGNLSLSQSQQFFILASQANSQQFSSMEFSLTNESYMLAPNPVSFQILSAVLLFFASTSYFLSYLIVILDVMMDSFVLDFNYSPDQFFFILSRSLKVFIKYLNPAMRTLGDLRMLTQTAPSTQLRPQLAENLSQNPQIRLARSQLFQLRPVSSAFMRLTIICRQSGVFMQQVSNILISSILREEVLHSKNGNSPIADSASSWLWQLKLAKMVLQTARVLLWMPAGRVGFRHWASLLARVIL